MRDVEHCDCGANSKVVDSRHSGRMRKRQRKCLGCGATWATYEIAKEDLVAIGEAIGGWGRRGPSKRSDSIMRRIESEIAS